MGCRCDDMHIARFYTWNAGAAVKTYGQSSNLTSITKHNFISSYEFSKKKINTIRNIRIEVIPSYHVFNTASFIQFLIRFALDFSAYFKFAMHYIVYNSVLNS